MSGPAETTAALVRRRDQLGARAIKPVGSGLRRTNDFDDNPGQLRMFSYAPAALEPGAALVVALHGCGQKAAGHAASAGWFSLADRMGFLVLTPEQSRANNINRCFNWFNGADIERGSGEAASISQMVIAAIKTYQLDPSRIYITGLSAGGAMAGAVLATYPDLFAGGAIIAGMPYGIAGNLALAVRAMRHPDTRSGEALAALVRRASPSEPRRWPRLSIWQGGADETVAPGNAEALARQWAALMSLQDSPDVVEPMDRLTRSTWVSGGRPVIELNLVEGLGHGTPLSTTCPGDVGASAPFMLEAGVSSSLEIVRFWGLAGAAATEPLETRTSVAAARGLGNLAARLAQAIGLSRPRAPHLS
jgi:poly(hydroxyalkanoate) depolymerase family esterase